MADESTSSQEERQQDYGPEQDQESYENHGEEGEQLEDSNQTSEKELFESRLEEERLKAQENFRSMQSNYDKQISKLTGMIETLQNQQLHSRESQDQPNQFVDEYGEPRVPTAEEIAQLVENKVSSVLNKQSQEQERLRQEQDDYQRQTDQWLASQKDKDEVLDYYNSNKHRLDSEMNDLANFESRYYYVRSKVLEDKLKKQRNKPNVPPVGNSGQNFSSRPKRDNGRSAFESAMSRNFQRKLENRASRMRRR